MNSNSKYTKDDCKHKCPSGNNVIFENCYGSLGPLNFTFSEGNSFQTFNQPIASVSVDASCKNIKDIIIDFTGILNVTTTVSATSTLTFALYKICDNTKSSQPVATVSYFVADIFGGVTTSHTLAFKFPFCNNDCDDCCSYVLELANIYNLDFGTITYDVYGNLSALVLISD